MRSESSFEIDGDLIVYRRDRRRAEGHDRARLVLDTGSVLTTRPADRRILVERIAP